MKSNLSKSLVLVALAMLAGPSLSLAATAPALAMQIAVPYACGSGSMVKPDAAASDSRLGRVYFADRCGWVNYYDGESGAWIGAWNTGAGNCSGIGVDDSSNVYIVAAPQIMKFTADGVLVQAWTTTSAWPSDIAFVPANRRLIVTEYPARVEAFSTTGVLVATVAEGGVNPYGVGVDMATSQFYVTHYDDVNQAFIRTYAADGAPAGQFGSFGTGDGQFLQPLDVAVGPDHQVYVADGTGNRIVEFDQAGGPLARWGDATMFRQVGGIALNSKGRVWAASHDRIGQNTIINIFGDPATPTANTSWGAMKVIYYR